MSKIVVLGAGVCGLACALMLARDDHEVVVLERDCAHAPGTTDGAWASWERAGVTQFRFAHFLQPAGRALLEAELPDVISALAAAGAVRFDLLSAMPPTITDREPRAGDERFVTLTARRPVLEHVLADLASRQAGLQVRRGVTVTGLTSTVNGALPHITGVRVDSGEKIAADLVVDVSGRRSRMPEWLRDAGTRRVHETAEPSGFTYYQRTFRSPDGSVPKMVAPVATDLGTITLVTLPADNGTWAVVIVTSSGDQPLKRLRDTDAWTSVMGACPLHRHWIDGEPLTPVRAMGGLIDRRRCFAPDGQPIATGIAAVGDAWACTNPSLGRGMSHGLRHAQRLRDTVREHLHDRAAFAGAWDHVTESELRPCYEDVIAETRHRREEIEAIRTGVAPPAPAGPIARFMAAVPRDPDVFRAFLENRAVLATMRDVLSRPALAQRIERLPAVPRVALPGPGRNQLLELVQTRAPSTA